MQIWITALIPSLVTIGSSIYINRKNSKYNSGLDKQITIFKNELEKKNNELKSELSKQEARFKNELEKQKKIAEIYYEERAKVLQELFILLINRPSDIMNLLTFLNETAKGGTWSNPQVYYDLYEELIKNEDKLKKSLLNSSLYLRNDDYITIKEFRDCLREPVKSVVDSFTLYNKIPDKNSIASREGEEFADFSIKTLKSFEKNSVFKYCEKSTTNISGISNIIKNTIASEKML